MSLRQVGSVDRERNRDRERDRPQRHPDELQTRKQNDQRGLARSPKAGPKVQGELRAGRSREPLASPKAVLPHSPRFGLAGSLRNSQDCHPFRFLLAKMGDRVAFSGHPGLLHPWAPVGPNLGPKRGLFRPAKAPESLSQCIANIADLRESKLALGRVDRPRQSRGSLKNKAGDQGVKKPETPAPLGPEALLRGVRVPWPALLALPSKSRDLSPNSSGQNRTPKEAGGPAERGAGLSIKQAAGRFRNVPVNMQRFRGLLSNRNLDVATTHLGKDERPSLSLKPGRSLDLRDSSAGAVQDLRIQVMPSSEHPSSPSQARPVQRTLSFNAGESFDGVSPTDPHRPHHPTPAKSTDRPAEPRLHRVASQGVSVHLRVLPDTASVPTPTPAPVPPPDGPPRSFRHLEALTKAQLSAEIRAFFDALGDSEDEALPQFPTRPEFYRVDRRIGKGCFGSVYLATQVLTDLPVALKAVDKRAVAEQQIQAKVALEVSILQAVAREAHLARLLEVFEDADRLYLVLEYLPHGDLISHFRTRPMMAEDELRGFFLKVVLSVRNLHRHGVIHRDIKMDNVLLDRRGEPVLCDFGISSVWDPKRPILDTGGTPAYLAPEVIRAKGEVCFKSDVWSLGVLLFALAFGRVPFEGRDVQELYHNILVGRVVLPEDPDISPVLRDLVARMLAPQLPLRLSVEEVLEHPWFARLLHPTLVAKTEVAVQHKRDEKAAKDRVIRQLNDAGFDIEFVCGSLRAAAFNHAAACYHNVILWGQGPR